MRLFALCLLFLRPLPPRSLTSFPLSCVPVPLLQWVFPPGVYLEQKKEWTEVIASEYLEGDQCKIVDCAPYIPAVRRTVSTSGAAKPKA